MTKNIAFIPAKTNSLRVPKKNYKVLNNKTLIDYTIELAIECDLIDKVIISSNEKISSSIKSEKIEYHLREGEEADPNISVIDLLNLMRKKNNLESNNLILLQPTHPFRKMKYLVDSISIFQDNLELESLVTVTNQKIRNINSNQNVVSMEKDIILSNKFINGQIYIFRCIESKEIAYGKTTLLYEIPQSEYDVNIDEPHDFRLAEILASSFEKG